MPEGTRLYLLAPIVRGPQGRVPQGVRRAAAAGLSAGQGRRRALRPRRRAGAGQEAETRDRGRRRPRGHRIGPRPAAGGIDRDGAGAGRRAVHRRERGQWRAADHVGQVRLPGLGLHPARDRAAPVLVQQPLRRLPGLRRAGPQDADGPRADRAGPGEVGGQGCGRALVLDHHELVPADAGLDLQALRRQPRHALAQAAGQGARGHPATAPAPSRCGSSSRTGCASSRPGSRSRAWSTTCSGAGARPSWPGCARSCRAT